MKKLITGRVSIEQLQIFSTNSCGDNANIYAQACPSRAVLELIADKWTLLILPSLWRGPRRNADLMRTIGGVSQKMLTQTLRELERNGLVRRIDHQEVPPRVEYDLTPLGRSLAEVVGTLDSWAEQHMMEVKESQRDFEQRKKRSSLPQR